jgi:methionyl-tRNA synthetase
MSQVIHVIAPPPTPNGDLHVGHMSGPYLNADLYAKTVRSQGFRANFVVSTDDHQSYVDTTARRLGTTPEKLITASRSEISASLASYGIQLSAFGVIDDAYTRFVQAYFERLHRQELVSIREVDVLYDNQLGCYAVEAFVSGICGHCLASAAGGICEACGQPNRCTDLMGLDSDRYQVRREPRLVLDLERFRPGLQERLGAMQTHRPWLRRLIGSLLARPLEPFVLSYKTPRGIGLDGVGLKDQRLNVWGEMFPGHIYFLSQSAGSVAREDRYVQFLGFDNSYFYVFVHLALSLAAQEAGFDWPSPEAFITNQFYNLENEKFSTSKGHLIWARDLAADFDTDVIRLFLALHGPEYQEADFSRDAFTAEAARLVRSIQAVVQRYNSGTRTGTSPAAAQELLAAMRPEISIDRYSASDNARRALNGIRCLTEGPLADQPGVATHIPALLALALEPFCPHYALTIRTHFGLAALSWTRLLPSEGSTPLPEFPLRNVRSGAQ